MSDLTQGTFHEIPPVHEVMNSKRRRQYHEIIYLMILTRH